MDWSVYHRYQVIVNGVKVGVVGRDEDGTWHSAISNNAYYPADTDFLETCKAHESHRPGDAFKFELGKGHKTREYAVQEILYTLANRNAISVRPNIEAARHDWQVGMDARREAIDAVRQVIFQHEATKDLPRELRDALGGQHPEDHREEDQGPGRGPGDGMSYPVVYCAGGSVIGYASTSSGAKRHVNRISHTPREKATAKLVDWDSETTGPLRDGTEINGKAWAVGFQMVSA